MKKVKFKKVRFVSIVLSIFLFTFNFSYCLGANEWVAKKASFNVLVQNKILKTDKPIVTINGTTYLPLRSIGEALNVPIKWNGSEKQVEIGTPNNKSTANLGSPNVVFTQTTWTAKKAPYKIIVGGKELRTSSPVVTIDGATYLPLREIGNALNAPIKWNEKKNQVEIGAAKVVTSTVSSTTATVSNNDTSSQNPIECTRGTWCVDREIPIGVYDIEKVTDVATLVIKDNFGKPFIATNYRDDKTDGKVLKNVVLDKDYIIQVDSGTIRLIFKQNIVSSSVSAATEYDQLLADFKPFFDTYINSYDNDYYKYATVLKDKVTYELQLPNGDSRKYYTATGLFYLSVGDGTTSAVHHRHSYIYKDSKWQLVKKEHINLVTGEWVPCSSVDHCK